MTIDEKEDIDARASELEKDVLDSGSKAETEEEKRILYNAAVLRAMPDNIGAALAKARSKPVWCSNVRWRMELARRRKKYLF